MSIKINDDTVKHLHSYIGLAEDETLTAQHIRNYINSRAEGSYFRIQRIGDILINGLMDDAIQDVEDEDDYYTSAEINAMNAKYKNSPKITVTVIGGGAGGGGTGDTDKLGARPMGSGV